MMIQAVRPAAVAGMFYTANSAELCSDVESYMAGGVGNASGIRALVAPHAGYQYSGPIAGSAYRCLKQNKLDIRRVYLFGPAHRVYTLGIATVSVRAFNTPLGEVEVDRGTLNRLEQHFDYLTVSDQSHALEHSLEVHLPFLQCALDDFQLVPLVVGDIAPQRMTDLMEQVLSDPEGLVIVSTDLSHYHDYRAAKAMDRDTIEHVEQLDWTSLNADRACGYVTLSALLICASRHHWKVKILDARNSGDTAGPRDQVVGYAALAVVDD